jgi:hypothetical protein
MRSVSQSEVSQSPFRVDDMSVDCVIAVISCSHGAAVGADLARAPYKRARFHRGYRVLPRL